MENLKTYGQNFARLDQKWGKSLWKMLKICDKNLNGKLTFSYILKNISVPSRKVYIALEDNTSFYNNVFDWRPPLNLLPYELLLLGYITIIPFLMITLCRLEQRMEKLEAQLRDKQQENDRLEKQLTAARATLERTRGTPVPASTADETGSQQGDVDEQVFKRTAGKQLAARKHAPTKGASFTSFLSHADHNSSVFSWHSRCIFKGFNVEVLRCVYISR